MKRTIRTPEPDEDEVPPRRRNTRTMAPDPEPDEPRGGRRRRPVEDNGADAEEESFKRPDLSGGWGRSEERRKTMGGGDFPDEWRVEETERLVIFLEDEPFSSYGQHWIEEKNTVTNKKGFICLEDGCPLCEIGDRPRSQYGFNVYVYTAEGEGRSATMKGRHAILLCGNRLFDQLKEVHLSKRQGSLSSYWRLLKRTGKGGNTGYTIETLLTDADLDGVIDDQDIDGDTFITDEELEALNLYDHAVIERQMWSPSRLDELAAAIS